MKGHDENLYWGLSELAAFEKDPEKVLAIAREIRRLVEENENCLKKLNPATPVRGHSSPLAR